ncbi:hypothetical protein SAMN05920897_104162 [Alkalispirochaeta americana]|uniref:DUF4390 domain-containing protein n=1 Tax=Alkalispirochaeta americana TaxID=159291 RepID=A0A1N6QGG9_9SPIO|nr:hypothetical protein [Alkalispirochaeta americana]SIQ15677.1 hypothetical protein SAMN05920897_104162 [Alkalispirochaeta americana]
MATIFSLTALVALSLAGPLQDAAARNPASREVITLEIWTIEDTLIHQDGSSPEERLLREARYTLSGMIYGWDFSYTPGDRLRQVEELFHLEPLGTVPWGAPELRLRETRVRDGTRYGQFDYRLPPEAQAHRSQWESFASLHSSGTARADLLEGYQGKIAALEKALHQAVREHLRPRHPNKPHQVRGSLVLSRPPRIRTVSGYYEATVTIALEIRDATDYLLF